MESILQYSQPQRSHEFSRSLNMDIGPKHGAESDSVSASSYLLHVARSWAARGKTDWILDAETGQTHSFVDLDGQTGSVASWLVKAGMRKGDHAIYMTHDVLSTQLFLVGVWRVGGVVRAIYPEEDHETLAARVQESRARWILCETETAGMCLAVAKALGWPLNVIVVGQGVQEGCTPFSELLADNGEVVDRLVDPANDLALILCTSGTTGRSKGAAFTHDQLLNQIRRMAAFPWTENKPNLIVAKMTHTLGLMFPFAVLVAGGLSLVLRRPSPLNLLRAVDKHRPGFIWAFPTYLLWLVEKHEQEWDLRSVEVCGWGGVIVTPAMEAALMTLPSLKYVFVAYGMTEGGPLTTTYNFKTGTVYPNLPPTTIGKAVPGVSLEIRDPSTGLALAAGKQGEICVKATLCFQSYFKNPEATADTITDGWVKTGDVGWQDDHGFVFLVGRIKEMFKCQGNHVSPAELEEIICRHPAAAEACVVGMPEPPSGLDYEARAFVVLKPGVNAVDGMAENIRAFANSQLASFKQLHAGLYLIDKLPRGKTGKVLRRLAAQIHVPY